MRLLLAFVFAVLVTPVALVAQEVDAAHDWWQWGGPSRDFLYDAPELADTWPAVGPPVIWSRPLGAGHSAVIAGGGRLYTMYRVAYGEGGSSPWSGDEAVIALDAATGETLWEHAYPSVVQDFDQGAGPHATPLLLGDRLFTIGTNKELHVFDAPTGEIVWSRNFVTDFGAPPLLIRSMIKSGYGVSPLPYKDTIIVQVGGPGQSVMALRQDDGSVVWRSGSFPGVGGPAGADHVRRRAAPGGLRRAGRPRPRPRYRRDSVGAPARRRQRLQLPDPALERRGRHPLSLVGYIGGSRAIKLRRDGGVTRVEELWYDPQLRFTFLNPIRLGDFVYGTSGQGATAIMTATHVATGETAWRERGFSRASLLQADGKTLILEEDGDLGMVVLTPNGMTRLASTPLFDSRSWTAPTLVGATLYARDREKIVALDMSK